MASYLRSVKCPECGRLAIEDYYYKIGEGFIYCQCCGLKLDRLAKYDREKNLSYFEEKVLMGYGKFFLQKKDGSITSELLNSPLTNEQIEKYIEKFSESDVVNQENSFLVSYKYGEFELLFGKLPDDFHLSFEEYVNKFGYDHI